MSVNILADIEQELGIIAKHNPEHIAKLALTVSADAATLKTDLLAVVNAYLTAKNLSALSSVADSVVNNALTTLQAAVAAAATQVSPAVANAVASA